jgi:predicted CXXCH cytochrome family protein
MKKLLIATLALMGGLGISSMASAAITGSAHDFTTHVWGGGQICLPCHAPHNNQNQPGELLWNHDMTIQSYVLYDSPTFDAVPGQPAGVSKFCLSCHDGTVALDAYTNHPATTNTIDVVYPGTTANLGTVLGNDHPISFPYDEDLYTKDGGLWLPSSLPPEIRLFDGKLECATCHDVHNKYALPALLNMSNEGSALCLTCHNK